MVSSSMSRLAALPALAALLAALVVVAPGTASAAAGDILTMEWATKSSTSSQFSQAADFTAGTSTSAMPAGAKLSIPGTFRTVTLAPPTGGRFTAGQTYCAAKVATATSAKLDVGGLVWSGSCQPYSGTVTILAADYDGTGTLTSLAADYRATCALFSGAQETVAGSVRHNTTEPWLTLKQVYQPDTVAVGRSRIQPVTVTASGADKSVQLGQASISGTRAADYRVADNGCAAATLSPGDSCVIDVGFEPLALTYGVGNPREALLSLDTVGHVTGPLTVRLASSATDVPGVPQQFTTYPTAGGVGLSWRDGSPAAQQFRVERRLAGDTDWSTVTTVQYGSGDNYVDHDVLPGQQVQYRLTGVNAGWDGDSATTATTRPMSVPTPGAESLVAYGSNNAHGDSWTFRQGVDGATITTWSGDWPTIQATEGPTSPGVAQRQVTFRAPVVPGPGEYRSADFLWGGVDFVQSAYNCGYDESVLDVRSVAYDETRKPLVFDASWVGRCANGTVVRLEFRLGVDGDHIDHAMTTTDPTVVGRLTTYGGRSETRLVTVSNSGPGQVTLGMPSLTGAAATDWLVTQNGCEGVVLDPQQACAMTVRFSSTADRLRPGVLEIRQRDATGALAPVTVPLDGYGATPPGFVENGTVRSTVGAVLVWWREPRDNGGLPVLSYEIQRAAGGTQAWTALPTVSVGDHPSYVDQNVAAGDAFRYRVRAVNEVGPGPWWPIIPAPLGLGERAVIVSGSVADTGLRGLFQVHGGDSEAEAPVIALTSDPQHDYRDPAVSPAGTRLAASVSVGDGTDGEYDLWTGTLADPTAKQVTSMPGSERGAAFSPDATQIAFTHVAADGSRSVWVVPAAGGQPHLVLSGAAEPAWTPDGRSLVVEDTTTADAPLLLCEAETGATSEVVGTAGASQPAVSRDGDIAYVDPQGRIMVLAAGSSTPTVAITPMYGRILGSPAWTDTGEIVYDKTWVDTGKPDFSLTYLLRVSGEPAPVRADLTDPWITPRGLGQYVRGEAHFEVAYGDNGETPVEALRAQCAFDGAPWTPCAAGPRSMLGLSEGQHRVQLRVTDEAGRTTTDSHYFLSDTVAPTLRLNPPALSAVLGGAPKFRWEGNDATSGSDYFDVMVRTASPTSDFGPYLRPNGWSDQDRRAALTTRLPPGEEVCVRVRVRDYSGLWSGYASRCAGRPLDDASLAASPGWRRSSGSATYQRTESVAVRNGATLRTRSQVSTRRVAVLAATCRTCGSVKVYLGSRYLGTVSLKSPRTRTQQLLELPVLPRVTRGTVTLRTTSPRTVRIDGLLLRRS